MLLSELTLVNKLGIKGTGSELRLVSLADRAVGLRLLRFSLDRDDVDVMLEAGFAISGLRMEHRVVSAIAMQLR